MGTMRGLGQKPARGRHGNRRGNRSGGGDRYGAETEEGEMGTMRGGEGGNKPKISRISGPTSVPASGIKGKAVHAHAYPWRR